MIDLNVFYLRINGEQKTRISRVDLSNPVIRNFPKNALNKHKHNDGFLSLIVFVFPFCG